MTRKALMLLATIALMVVAASAVATAATPMGQDQVSPFTKAHLEPVGDSGVHGSVFLFQLPTEGTQIVVLANGLKPGKRYVSLYYDVIGGPYTALPNGVGFTTGTADDDLDEINSVSVRSAKNFTLRACATVHH